jgi:hypothetical protein
VVLLGSQTRRSDRGGGRRGKGGRGELGKGAGEGGGREEEKERYRIYQKATARRDNALRTRDFSYAAQIATSVVVSRAPVQEAISLFLAGARAFSEGKEREWTPKPTELAKNGIRYAQEKTGYELTLERQQLFSNILANNLGKIAEKYRRKTP